MNQTHQTEATWSRILPLSHPPRAIVRVSLTYRKHTRREGYYAAIATGTREKGVEVFTNAATVSRLLESTPWSALKFFSFSQAMSEPERLKRVQERMEGGEVSVAMSVLCGVTHEASHAVSAAVEL